jgi:3-dehydroquinate synthase
MSVIPVKLGKNSYSIVIGNHILSNAGNYLKKLSLGKDAVIVTHRFLNQKHGGSLIKGLKKNGFSVKVFEVPEGEKSKSAKYAFDLIEKIARYDVLKSVFIVAFGGGVVGDLAGYVAAAYKRGIPYVQIPTTLLAQIDSSIGGKVAIDLPFGKNLVGAFHQPKIVLSDVAILKTLDKRQVRNGLAEAVKYGIIDDKPLFDFIDVNLNQILSLQEKETVELVTRCSRIKAKVVIKDEFETKGLRTILNFGHTVGHAIEAAGRFEIYHHGEAIALGMRVAAHISEQLQLTDAKTSQEINRLLTRVGLPEQIKGMKKHHILNMMRHDKKFVQGKNRFVLVTKIGQVVVKKDIPASVISKAIQAYLT